MAETERRRRRVRRNRDSPLPANEPESMPRPDQQPVVDAVPARPEVTLSRQRKRGTRGAAAGRSPAGAWSAGSVDEARPAGSAGPAVPGGGSAGPVVPGGGSASPVAPGGGSAGPAVPGGGSAGPVVPGGGSAGPAVPGGRPVSPAVFGAAPAHPAAFAGMPRPGRKAPDVPDGGGPELAAPHVETAPVHDPEPPAPDRPSIRRNDDRTAEDKEVERGLRGLVGAGSSQVSAAAAMRARDAARATDGHVAEAEAELMIVRRGWVPRDPLAR